jgi:hypothetical protein
VRECVLTLLLFISAIDRSSIHPSFHLTHLPSSRHPFSAKQMSTSREDSVYLAKLAEQAERYEGEWK